MMIKTARTTAGKIICFILTVVFTFLFAASVFGICLLLNYDFYTRPMNNIIADATTGQFHSSAYRIVNSHFSHDVTPLENTNLLYAVADESDKIIATNISGEFSVKDKTWLHAMFIHRYYDDNISELFFNEREPDYAANHGMTHEIYAVYADINPALPCNDYFADVLRLIDFGYDMRFAAIAAAAVLLALAITGFVLLMYASARRAGSNELRPGPLHAVPFDLLTAGGIFLILLAVYAVSNIMGVFSALPMEIVIICALILYSLCILLGLCMSAAARVKTKTLAKNTIIGRLFRFIIKCGRLFFQSVPMIWRAVVLAAAAVFADFMIIIVCTDISFDIGILLWILKTFIFANLFLFGIIAMNKIKKGGNAIAGGDLNYRINTDIMFFDFKKHAENLNSISLVTSKAVQERLKSERLKTELITNVSHDIKNPITSIINYSELISEEKCNCEKHAEYSEVLQRKSEHLKRLLDDLVEVSKASTGNMTVDLLPCDAGVLINQIFGEFEEKFSSSELELCVKQPEEQVTILADNRKIWRVFENLMSNACKYSAKNTRVYLSLEKIGDSAVFTVKNISKDELDISPDELMERFVRGDSSRTTEGSGLGLSIAKSLTELQGGEMEISIDGDLFKAAVKLKTA